MFYWLFPTNGFTAYRVVLEYSEISSKKREKKVLNEYEQEEEVEK